MRFVVVPVLFAVLMHPGPSTAQSFEPEVIALTRPSTPETLRPSRLGQGPSVNAYGEVAFTAIFPDGAEGIFVRSLTATRTLAGPVRGPHYPGEVRIDNQGRVVALEIPPDSLGQFLHRRGPGPAQIRVIAQSDFDGRLVSPFMRLHTHPWMNSLGQVVFSAMPRQFTPVTGLALTVEPFQSPFVIDSYEFGGIVAAAADLRPVSSNLGHVRVWMRY